MSTHQSQPPDADQRELDTLLARGGRLSAAWRGASEEEPPAALDDAIRAAARRAVGAGPRQAGAAFAQRWRVPMSIAAVLVASATLTLLLSEQGAHLPGAALREAPSEPEPSAIAHLGAQPAAGMDAADAKLAQRSGESESPVPPAAGMQDAARAAPSLASPGQRSKARESPEVLAHRVMPPASPASPAPAVRVPEDWPGAAMQSTPERSNAAAPAAGAPAPAPNMPAAASEPQLGFEAPAPLVAPVASVPASVAARPTAAVPAEPAPAGAMPEARRAQRAERAVAVEADTLAASTLTPQVWVERIQALQRAGKVQEALRSLEEFRRRYPDYRLPPELAALPRAPASD